MSTPSTTTSSTPRPSTASDTASTVTFEDRAPRPRARAHARSARRHPGERDRADALCRFANCAAQLAQPRVGRLAASRDLLDDQSRIAARVDPVQSEAARVLETGQQCAVLGDVRPRDTDRFAVRGEHGAVGSGEHVADRRGARVAARSAVGGQDRIAASRRGRRWPRPPPARLGKGTSFGVAVGTAATAVGSAPLGSSHGDDTREPARGSPLAHARRSGPIEWTAASRS